MLLLRRKQCAEARQTKPATISQIRVKTYSYMSIVFQYGIKDERNLVHGKFTVLINVQAARKGQQCRIYSGTKCQK